MKPQPPFAPSGKRRFPLTDFCFQSDLRGWCGWSWSDGDDDTPARRFNELNREFLRESRREHQREMIAFGFVMLIAAWPICYMVYILITLLLRGHSFDR